MRFYFHFVFFFLTIISCAFSADVNKGKELFQKCAACHGNDGEGKKSMMAPRLAGQYSWYVSKQIHDMKNKTRTNSNVNKMIPFIKGLSDGDIENLSAYIESLQKK